MANQIKGSFEARQPTIKQYLEKVKEVLKGFDTFTIEHVRRNQNKKADALSKFGVPKAITSKDDKQLREGIFAYLYSGLNVTQSFSPITGHVEIMNHIEKKLVRSQHGWANDLARVLLVHRTLPRNSQGKSPFTLTYGSEAIIPLAASLIQVSKGHSSKDKRKEVEGREVASIKEAYYRNKLRRYYDARSSRSRFKLGDFVLLFQDNKEGHNVWKGPHIISGVCE
ncbi:reverse transcriptase domain-containing protein [Tanacetum coccineum]